MDFRGFFDKQSKNGERLSDLPGKLKINCTKMQLSTTSLERASKTAQLANSVLLVKSNIENKAMP